MVAQFDSIPSNNVGGFARAVCAARHSTNGETLNDDLGDYSTNEPTLEGTASLMFVLAHFSR